MYHDLKRRTRGCGSGDLASARPYSRMESAGNPPGAGRLAILLMAGAAALSAQQQQTWRQKLEDRLSLFGHRNWIVVADSAYPLQSGPGIETIVSTDGQLDTIRQVLFAISRQTHLRPVV